jgi:hypothetical protein
MKSTPEDLVCAAHRHEQYAQRALGLDDDAVLGHAPMQFRNTRTRAAYVEGLRCAQRSKPSASAAAHLAMADALYWCLARRSVDILRPRRRSIAYDSADATQEGLLWLVKAAQRFQPGMGAWKRYAISWLMAAGVRGRAGGLSLHDRETLARLQRLLAHGEAVGHPPTRQELARSIGRPVEFVDRLLSAATPLAVVDEHEPDATDEDENASLNVDLLLARLTPREAWALARRYGLWHTRAVSCRVIGAELDIATERATELIRDAAQHVAAAVAPTPWAFDRRGLRWALLAHTGASIGQIASREGVPVGQVATAVRLCRDEAGLLDATSCAA